MKIAAISFPLLAAFLFYQTAGSTGCDPFYDEGARFGVQLGHFAHEFAKSKDTEAEFVYTPRYGVNQSYRVGMGASRFCPHPPCDPLPGRPAQGAVTVWVEKGKSGTGYAHKSYLGVPEPLGVQKRNEPVRVLLRKNNGIVEAVGLR
jgi:hypothetical protein